MGAGAASVGTSSAQLWVVVAAAGVAFSPVSVSAGSRGTSTSSKPSGPEVIDWDSLLSQLASATAFAAPVMALLGSGTVEVSECLPTPFKWTSPAALISVRPAFMTVGSLSIAIALSGVGIPAGADVTVSSTKLVSVG